MSQAILTWVVSNSLFAATMTGVVYAITRYWRVPARQHALWLLVLLKLIAPPLVAINIGLVVWSGLHASQSDSPNRYSFPKVIARIPHEISPESSSPEASRIPITTTQTDTTKAISLPTWQWQDQLVVAWLAVAVVWSLLAVWRIQRFHCLISRLSLASSDRQAMLAQVCRNLGYCGRVELVTTSAPLSPLLWPIGTPRIIVPECLLVSFAPGELRSLVAHEVAHLVRRDHWVRWIDLAVLALYWWNPVTWWARRELRITEEEACDARVVSVFPELTRAYVRALLKANKHAVSTIPYPCPAGSFLSSHSLKRRVETMLISPRESVLNWQSMSPIVILAMLFIPWGVVSGAPQESKGTASTTTSDIEKMRPATTPTTVDELEKNGIKGSMDPSAVEDLVRRTIARTDAIHSGQFQYLIASKILGQKDEWRGAVRYAFDRTGWVRRLNGLENSWEQFPDGTSWYLERAKRYWKMSNHPQTTSPSLTVEYSNKCRLAANEQPPTQSGTLQSNSMRDYVREWAKSVVFIGEQNVDDHVCSVFEVPVSADDSGRAFGILNEMLLQGGALRMYCAKDLGYALPIIECRDRFDAVQISYRASKFQRINKDLYFPLEFEFHSATYTMRYEFSEVSHINEPLPETTFELAIPAATRVADARPHMGDPGNGRVTLKGYPFRQFITGTAYPHGFPEKLLQEMDRGLVEEPDRP